MLRVSTTFFLTVCTLLSLGAQNIVNVTDADLQGGQTYNWTNDNVYQLDGYVYLEAGGVLNIQAGTRIEGLAVPTNSNDLASTLIITRGAQIQAIGTAEEPIVFTAEDENGDFEIPADRGSWGGLVILGNAFVGEENGTGIANVEGITAENRTAYGGGANPVDNDNSGTLRYVSIRYGGATLANDSEINGLTLGGVGSGTVIDYIEVFGNTDDGIELFGGSVDIKHAVVAFCGDDSFDTDQAWSGRGQFWFTIQLPNDATGNNQNGGEHDGSEEVGEAGPVQTVYNATYIGMGADADNGEANTALRIKNGAAITYGNSIFTGFGRDFLRVQDESYDRFLAGDFLIENNIVWDFGDGPTYEDIVRVDDGDNAINVIARLSNQVNVLTNPQLFQINRAASTNGGADGLGTDPRPLDASIANNGSIAPPNDDFFEDVSYVGAFAPASVGGDYWVRWTHAFEQGYLVDQLVNTIDYGQNAQGLLLTASPNPTVGLTTLTIEVPAATEAGVTIYDLTGRQVRNLDLGRLTVGTNQPTIDLAPLTNGNYFIVVTTEFGAVSQKITVSR